jgi:hypothetical protein
MSVLFPGIQHAFSFISQPLSNPGPEYLCLPFLVILLLRTVSFTFTVIPEVRKNLANLRNRIPFPLAPCFKF